jgi:hypothetical protein
VTRPTLAALTVGLTLLAGAGCTSGPDRSPSGQSRPSAPASPSAPVHTEPGAIDGSAGTPEPFTTYGSDLKPTSETVMFLTGKVSKAARSTTTSAHSGELLMRTKCRTGSLSISVTVDGAGYQKSFSCTDAVEPWVVGPVRKGQAVIVELSGTTGAEFAMLLIAGPASLAPQL